MNSGSKASMAQRMFNRLKATMALDAPVTNVSGVSLKRASALKNLKISTIRDLVFSFPRRYIDMSQVSSIKDASIGKACTIQGVIHEVVLKRPRPRMSLVQITITDGTGTLIVGVFHRANLAKALKKGDKIIVAGKVEFNYGFKRMTNPFLEVQPDADEQAKGVIQAVWPLTGDIKSGVMRAIMSEGLKCISGTLDPLPLNVRSKYRLMSRQNALKAVHFPESMEQLRQAKRRLAYEEVLLLQLALMQDMAKRTEGKQPVSHVVQGAYLDSLRSVLPFKLTEDQVTAIEKILESMASPSAMDALLLGDVGTGKTVVAAFALAAAVQSGNQALFMAPTELLAQQHAETLGPLLSNVGISWAILTGSTDATSRAQILNDAKDGSLSVIFGTHALIEEDVKLNSCSLVVIDEQQRFGVAQRQALVDKGVNPDVLSLTATPIPRSLALALYGAMTLAYLHTAPARAQERLTQVHSPVVIGGAYERAREAIERGEQVFVLCPLIGTAKTSKASESAADYGPDSSAASAKNSKSSIDASQDSFGDGSNEPTYEYALIAIESEEDFEASQALATPKAAYDEADYLRTKIFPGAKVELLHGRMSGEEKARIMDEFRRGEIDVLVSTTVIEVGLDVPNATVMIVQDADRFGLAQLHQLRGRVGRHEKPGEFHLISGTKDEVALSRLKAMETINDGFELANYDLSLRREGDILGNRQHGASLLKLVNVVRDAKLIEAAWSDAKAIMAQDPAFKSADYKALGREVQIAKARAEALELKS